MREVVFFVQVSLCVLLLPGTLAHAGETNRVTKAMTGNVNDLEWWKRSVVYQVYPRSFKDSNGTGIGDLKGIREKIDYFVDLGVEAVWISPFFKSPMKDFGYDVSDFRDVDPIFGTMEDFRNLAGEFKKRGLYLILDIVPNHSSDEHDWFKKSVNRISPYTDYYVWKDANGTDANGRKIPPTNWVSVFGGSMWEWNEVRQQFYLHQFAKEQPDLNYENPAVRDEMLAIFKFWLDAGVDGFRVDAVPHIYEDQSFKNEVPSPDRVPEALPDEYRYWDHSETYNLPKVLDFLADVRQMMDVYSRIDGRQRCMMVESSVSDADIMEYYGTRERPIAHFPFNFMLLSVTPDMNASEVQEVVNRWRTLMPAGSWATYLIGNHDQKRAATRWTEDNVDGSNMINLLLQGTAVTYYGEELGMTDKNLTWEETVDPAACNTDENRYHIFSRDPARTPMQWDNTTSAGFSTSNVTWLPVHENYLTINVQAQQSARSSHLKVYKELVNLRYTDAWYFGQYMSGTLENDQILGFSLEASGRGGKFLVLINFSDRRVAVDATKLLDIPDEGKVLVKSVNFGNQPVEGDTIKLTDVSMFPRSSIVIEIRPLTRYPRPGSPVV